MNAYIIRTNIQVLYFLQKRVYTSPILDKLLGRDFV
jgi:hypothetical protein